MVGDPEHGPDGVDGTAPDHATPGDGDEGGGDDHAGEPVHLFEGSIEFAEEFLEEEASDPGSGIDGGEDEEGFEHDGEVEPVFEHTVDGESDLGEGGGHDIGHPDGEGHGTTGATAEGFSADMLFDFGEVIDTDAEFDEFVGEGGSFIEADIDGVVIGLGE